jgi:cell division septum initiation protein DivIVA
VVPADPDRPRTGSTGPHPAAQPTATPRSGLSALGFPAPRQAPPPPARFPTVRNGYDPAQVDRRIADLTARLGAVDEQRIDVTRRLAAERRRAEQIEQELRGARGALQAAREGGGPDVERGTGFGYRAERIMRMAEAEARDMRSTAAAEAAALLERTHADAEAHRHEVEQGLIARRTGQDQEAAQRTVDLDTREATLSAELDAARAEAARLREEARREVAELRQDAETAIERARAEAEQAADRRRQETTAELDRLTAVQDGLREELTRLHGVITAALPADSPEPTGPAAAPVPAAR